MDAHKGTGNSNRIMIKALTSFHFALLVGFLLFTLCAMAQGPSLAPGTSVPATLPNAPDTTPSPTQASSQPEKRGFFTRLGHAYLDDWTVDSNGAPASPAPERRGNPAPLNSPPFPGADWPIGGTVAIGAPDYNTYPLMQAINENKTRFKMYGWFDIGGNASTSNKGKYANGETAYDVIPNSIQLDQAALYFERLPNTVQTDHIDWGFRFTNLYGLDYRYTTALGIFSQQLLSYQSGQTYGYDPVMYYFDLYLPRIGKGTDVRIGRYISLPDIEAQLAPNNYTYSHSLLYTFDAYTQTGINVTTKFSDHWLFQIGLSPGNDVAPWATRDAQLTLNTCLGYTWRTGLDNIYVCENSLNKGNYAYNNLQASYFTWYHKFSKDGSWHTAVESWYQYEKKTPNVNNPAAASLIEVNANGAFCALATQVTCFAPEWAIVNYVEKQLSKHDYLTIRNECFDDLVGQRTGFKTPYTEHLLGWGHWVGSTVLFRPELRWEHSYELPVYDNGTRHSQLTFASDVIFFF